MIFGVLTSSVSNIIPHTDILTSTTVASIGVTGGPALRNRKATTDPAKWGYIGRPANSV